jgi:aspartate kinase
MVTSELEALPEAGGHDPAAAPATVVMHFGGASVGDPARIREVAARLVAERHRGARVVGVISAMGRTTDQLLELARRVSPGPDPRELDMLLSVGERISCALVAMAVRDLGPEAISLTGSQAGIITDNGHGNARIVEVRARRIHQALDADRVVLVAGFQGMSEAKDITTLGSGGTDTSAVALAASLGADVCELYAGIEGISTADPKLVPNARRHSAVSYEAMLELAAAGTGPLQLRSLEFARRHGVRLHVRSTDADDPGTWIMDKNESMEKAAVSGVAHTLEEVVYRVQGPDPSELFTALAGAQVNVDTIIQAGADVIVFSAPLKDRVKTARALDALGATWSERDDLAKVVVVGGGMKNQPGVAARTFETLRNLRIEPHFISTSPIRISFYVPHDDVEAAVRGLHDAFELGSPVEVADA